MLAMAAFPLFDPLLGRRNKRDRGKPTTDQRKGISAAIILVRRFLAQRFLAQRFLARYRSRRWKSLATRKK
jgi:hypothetical protein